MKIICKKETEIKKMTALIRHLLEAEIIDYPILKEDLIIELSLKDNDGQTFPKNDETIILTENDLQHIETTTSIFEYYYNNDALTKLYNRGKYERDLIKLQTNKIDNVICIYIDAIGLHEINNHLGHIAGDHMLCSIAEGIHQYFAQSLAYRIGGDEFVILCFQQKEAEILEAITNLRAFLSQEKYEISIGMEISHPDISLQETINRAEQAMRQDKALFYQHNGKQRQMRILNTKLEELLLEKQDANQFLNVIASEYKGVYMVNPDKDTCRYIYIPEYFKDILEEHNGIFSESIRTYCDRFVSEKDQEHFQMLYNFDDVLKQIKQGNQIRFIYEKKDGSKIQLQITIYDPNALDNNEMLWIFMDSNKV